MILKGIEMEDFVNYKKPSMFIAFPNCTFKCEKESGVRCCQNSALATSPNIDISIDEIVSRYITNEITEAIVVGGLEPLDDLHDLERLIQRFRDVTDDDIVIYTGYTEEEASIPLTLIGAYRYPNIIVKYGRFIPNSTEKYDDILGVTLASDNQYAVEYSKEWERNNTR